MPLTCGASSGRPLIFNLDDAKALLFFDMSKFLGKKMQEMVVFWKISAKISKFRSKNARFRAPKSCLLIFGKKVVPLHSISTD